MVLDVLIDSLLIKDFKSVRTGEIAFKSKPMNHSKSLYKIIFIILLLPCFANSQTWQWSRQIGSTWWDIAGNVAIDNYGNSYSAGIFEGGYCYFPGDTSNMINGDSDFYLAKFDPNGNLLWWRQIGGNNGSSCSEGVSGIAVDVNNDIYFTGLYCGQATFGSFVLNGSGLQDGFIAKYDDNGNCLWAHNIIGSMESGIASVSCDQNGFVYACGTNNSVALIGSTNVPAGGFIAKFDTNGNCLWAKKKISTTLIFSQTYCAATPQSIKHGNNLITISGFMGSDTVTFDNTTIYSKFGFDYVAAFDTSGSLKWVKTFGGPQANGVSFEHATDQFGNIYLSGYFDGLGYFDTDTLTGSNLQAFVVKIDSSGTEQWVKGLKAAQGSRAKMTSCDSLGNSYTIGYFGGNAWFGNYNVVSSTNRDMFVTRFNSDGDCLGVRSFGEAEGYGVTQDNNGNAIVLGNFSNTVTIGSNSYTSYGDRDIFIAKLDELVGLGETRVADNELVIYANPNAGRCTIKMPDKLLNEKDLVLTIYDAIGRHINEFKVTTTDGKISLNLEEEPKGIYAVTLGNSKVMYHGKIVFE